MGEQPPKIESAVEEKIDQKIEAAQLPRIPDQVRTQESLSPDTTLEQDRKSAGQRDINFTWEDTQRKIALFVVFVTMGISGFLIVISLVLKIMGFDIDVVLVIAAFTFMSSTTSLVVGFYFSRTNHARIGDEPDKRDRGALDDR